MPSVCAASTMRILAYKPHQLKDNTYSGADSLTWSIVEQGIGIVCACLPTLRPLVSCIYTGRSKSGTSKHGSGRVGMSSIRSKAVYPDITIAGKSAWKAAANDCESTVGFTRLQDEDTAMSPADVQRSVYAPAPAPSTSIMVAISTVSGEDDEKAPSVVQSKILEERSVRQGFDMVPQP